MTEPEDKTGRHGSWANKIPLISLIVFVFAAGGAFTEAKFTRKAIDALTASMKEHTAAESARLKAIEDWRISHEASTAPLLQDYVEERRTRSERKRK